MGQGANIGAWRDPLPPAGDLCGEGRPRVDKGERRGVAGGYARIKRTVAPIAAHGAADGGCGGRRVERKGSVMTTVLEGHPGDWRRVGRRAAALVGGRGPGARARVAEDDLRRVEEILDAAIARGLAQAAEAGALARERETVRLARAADTAALHLVVELTHLHGPDHPLTHRACAALERAYVAELAACAPFLVADDHPALDHVIASYGARAARRDDEDGARDGTA